MRLRNARPRSLALLGVTAVVALGLVAPATAAPAPFGPGGNPAAAVRPVLRGIDLESATIPDLQRAMDGNRLRSVQLTAFYLRRIRALNPELHAVIATNPDAMRIAAAILAAGALVDAVDRVLDGDLEGAFCAVRPPGHHAESGRACAPPAR